MGLTKTEINLRRLLAAMPEQTNQAKLAQYIVTLKEQLALLTGESGQGNLPCITEEKAKEYSEQIEAAASRVKTDGLDMWETLTSKDAQSDFDERPREDLPSKFSEDSSTAAGLRRRLLLNSNASNKNKGVNVRRGDHKHDPVNGGRGQRSKAGSEHGSAVKADSTLELMEKHRHLQENLTDEMVDLARQMKEASLSMNRAVLDSEKVLDSTEQAVEHSLASTNQANKRAQDIYSQAFKTGCLTWLIIFVMFSMFLLMVFLIRIT